MAAKTSRPIEKQTVAAWWCPFDAHSNMHGVTTCGGCGAVRDGDAVRVPRALAGAIAEDDDEVTGAGEAARIAQENADRAATADEATATTKRIAGRRSH